MYIIYIPAVFSHAGQIHHEFKAFVRDQIRHKLIDFEGEPKSSKIKAGMKWWTKCISMAIARTTMRLELDFILMQALMHRIIYSADFGFCIGEELLRIFIYRGFCSL